MKKDQTPRDLLDWLGLRRYPDWRVARPIGMIFGMAATVLFALAVIAAFATVSRAIGGGAGSAGGNLGAGALIVAVLGAPFLIWGTIIKHRTLSAQMDGQITDRISKAVEQLGAEKTVKEAGEGGATVERTRPNIEVRIGAILSLERIAQDSTTHDHGRDHVRVMEILCAYVRENAKAENLEPTLPPFERKTPRIDIQMAMNVIKRRSDEQVALEAARRYRLDLRNTDLDGCDLSKGKFAGAIFWRSRLEAAVLSRSDISGTRMQGTLLNFAEFWDARLWGTNFDHSIMSKPVGNTFNPSFTVGDVNGVSVVGADLRAIDYFGTNPAKIYGSKDTKLSDEMQSVRDELNNLKRQLGKARRAQDRERTRDLENQIEGSPLSHWFDFDSSDLALGFVRKKFYDRLGIVGWPYDD